MSQARLRIIVYIISITVQAINGIDLLLRFEWASHNPEMRQWTTFKFKFLTIWTFFLQIIYSFLGLYCDLTSLSKKRSELHQYLLSVRETLFAALVWPTGVAVCVLFWPLYLYDEWHIFPIFYKQIVTSIGNHVVHTFVLPVVVWELWLLPRTKTSHLLNVTLLTSFIMSYIYVLFHTYYVEGVWIYPMFKRTMGTIYFPIIFIVTFITYAIAYSIQWPLYKLMNKTNSTQNGIEKNVKKTK